jgi:hypothetical protein
VRLEKLLRGEGDVGVGGATGQERRTKEEASNRLATCLQLASNMPPTAELLSRYYRDAPAAGAWG